MPLLRPDPDALCVCGHAYHVHEHFRTGTDCGQCGRDACPKFRRAKGEAR